MMRSLTTFLFTVILAFSGPASAAVSFINPPPPSGMNADFTTNQVYTEGSAIQVIWTGTGTNGIPFSVVVYQVDISRGTRIPNDQVLEYVVHDSVNITSSSWVVGTAKDLAYSNVFVFALFFKGDTVGRALSQWFNISSRATDATQQPTETATVLPVSVTHTVTPSSTAPSAPPTASDGGLSTVAKIAVAMGAVAAATLGVVAGWFLSRRRNRGRNLKKRQLESGTRSSHTKNQSFGSAGLGMGFGDEVAVPEKARVSTVIFHEVPQKPTPREVPGLWDDARTPRPELYGAHP